MKTANLLVFRIVLIFALAAGVAAAALGQWQPGDLVPLPPKCATYYSLRLGTSAPPLPTLPPDMLQAPVYFIGNFEGAQIFVYDDRVGQPNQRTIQSSDFIPWDDILGGSGGSDTNYVPERFPEVGTNLWILIGPVSSSQAWLRLTNTHYQLFYQLETRPSLASSAAWELGQIVQDTGGTNQVSFANTRTDNPLQRFFRGVSGDTIASIAPDPDYNLAIEPASPTNAPQVGKFQVTLSPALGADRTVLYQISGTATNGTDYTNLPGSVVVHPGAASEIVIGPKFDSTAKFDRSVTISLILTNGYLVNPAAAAATLKIYDPRPTSIAVAILDSGWTKLNGLSSTNWNYFVLPEAMKVALRSDGTPYAVFSDLDIANGALMSNGIPKYPILICLGTECIRDEEIAALTNYVGAGGFVLAGPSRLKNWR